MNFVNSNIQLILNNFDVYYTVETLITAVISTILKPDKDSHSLFFYIVFYSSSISLLPIRSKIFEKLLYAVLLLSKLPVDYIFIGPLNFSFGKNPHHNNNFTGGWTS